MKATGVFLGMFLALLLDVACVCKATAADKRPNILFIITDQQHAEMLHCSGNRWLRTPAMDGLAREGVRFERAYCTNPVCVPSRISMATGLMPGRVGVFSNKNQAHLSDEIARNSLGKLMQSAGYDTFYGGKVHLCRELDPRNAGYRVIERDQRARLPDACIEFIQEKRDKPFFAVASFINPHDICFAHRAKTQHGRGMPSVNRLYQIASALTEDQLPPLPDNYAIPHDEPNAIGAHLSPKAVTPAITMRKEYTERDWRIYRSIYCRLTEQVDRHLGRILAAINRQGLEEKTLILFTSDHGNMDASHRLASKGVFYDESTRVPLLMKYKGVVLSGQVDSDHLVSTGLDILPTLCDYAGLEKPQHLLGLSLRRLAEGESVNDWREYIVSENAQGRMIRSNQFKYCVYERDTNHESLVDMDQDPGEMKNLASLEQYEQSLNQHRLHLMDWIKRSNDKAGQEFVVPEGERVSGNLPTTGE